MKLSTIEHLKANKRLLSSGQFRVRSKDLVKLKIKITVQDATTGVVGLR